MYAIVSYSERLSSCGGVETRQRARPIHGIFSFLHAPFSCESEKGGPPAVLPQAVHDEQVCKPGSVFGNHLSRPAVAGRLERPTFREAPSRRLSGTLRTAVRGSRGCARSYLSIRSCSGWGLHGGRVSAPPVSSYLAISPLPAPKRRRYVSVALSLGSPPADVIRHPALRSPDFPPGGGGIPARRLPGLLIDRILTYSRGKRKHFVFRKKTNGIPPQRKAVLPVR